MYSHVFLTSSSHPEKFKNLINFATTPPNSWVCACFTYVLFNDGGVERSTKKGRLDV